MMGCRVNLFISSTASFLKRAVSEVAWHLTAGISGLGHICRGFLADPFGTKRFRRLLAKEYRREARWRRQALAAIPVEDPLAIERIRLLWKEVSSPYACYRALVRYATRPVLLTIATCPFLAAFAVDCLSLGGLSDGSSTSASWSDAFLLLFSLVVMSGLAFLHVGWVILTRVWFPGAALKTRRMGLQFAERLIVSGVCLVSALSLLYDPSPSVASSFALSLATVLLFYPLANLVLVVSVLLWTLAKAVRDSYTFRNMPDAAFTRSLSLLIERALEDEGMWSDFQFKRRLLAHIEQIIPMLRRGRLAALPAFDEETRSWHRSILNQQVSAFRSLKKLILVPSSVSRQEFLALAIRYLRTAASGSWGDIPTRPSAAVPSVGIPSPRVSYFVKAVLFAAIYLMLPWAAFLDPQLLQTIRAVAALYSIFSFLSVIDPSLLQNLAKLDQLLSRFSKRG